MPYLESLEQAKQFGLDAARLMDQHDIALNPDNYMVWYEYVAGRSPELASALDVLIDDIESGRDYPADPSTHQPGAET